MNIPPSMICHFEQVTVRRATLATLREVLEVVRTLATLVCAAPCSLLMTDWYPKV